VYRAMLHLTVLYCGAMYGGVRSAVRRARLSPCAPQLSYGVEHLPRAYVLGPQRYERDGAGVTPDAIARSSPDFLPAFGLGGRWKSTVFVREQSGMANLTNLTFATCVDMNQVR
jgi:hypothetical protein